MHSHVLSHGMTSPEVTFFALFMVGFLGSPHCIGMCGGIVGAISMQDRSRLSLQLTYNAGRLISYMTAGALVGFLGSMSLSLSDFFPVRLVLSLMASLILVALGIYLMGRPSFLGFTERLGQYLWRYISPLSRRFLPANTIYQAFPLGLLWGWLPCGMVYSALFSAFSTASVYQGAGAMLAFGLGTLPTLLLAGLFAIQVKRFLNQKTIRIILGTVVLFWGLKGIYSTLLPFLKH